MDQELLQQRRDLLRGAILDQPLDDPAAVAVLRHPAGLLLEGLHDEVDPVRGQPLDTLLDHVVPMLILDALNHVAFELTDEQHLLLDRHGVQRFLDDAAAVHLQRQTQDLTHELFGQDAPLLRVAIFKKLLDDVVTKDVAGELLHLLEHGLEGDLLFLLIGHLQLLLDQPGAILILRDFADVPREITELHIPVPRLQLFDQRVGGLRPADLR
mmetsp:Transcript_17494/g.47927  ORF Transcript_17494/g.47927 Transcript_17494/m.47927 type:complete len:212 (+) Transcript_17494:516-1151(+)